MKKPNNFENTQANGEYTPVELGGHMIVIKQVEERQSKHGKIDDRSFLRFRKRRLTGRIFCRCI